MSEGRGTAMLVGIVVLAAWAAVADPVSIPVEKHRPEQAISHHENAVEANTTPVQRFSITGEIIAHATNDGAPEKEAEEHKEGGRPSRRA